MAQQFTVETFAKSIKDKYPQYSIIPDAELTQKMLAKYPQYKDKVSIGPAPSMLAGQKQVLASEFEKANPGSTVTRDPNTGQMTMQPGSTFGSRAREAAIGIMTPATATNILSTAKQLGSSFWTMLTQPGNPQPAIDLAKGAVESAVEPVVNWVQGIRGGDYDRAANASGVILSQTVPAVEGAAKAGGAAAGGVMDLADLRTKARQFAQNRVGANALKTTEPIVEKYNTGVADSAAKQAEQAAAHRQGAAETITANREAEHANARTEAVNRSIEEGSKRLGESVKDLDLKLAEEDNGLYAPVEEAVAQDKGIPSAQVTEAAKNLYQQYLEGSTKKPAGFSELMRKTPEEGGGLKTNIGFDIPQGPQSSLAGGGPGILKLLQEQGLVDAEGGLITNDTIGYGRLKRISSELGAKLADRNLPRAEYKAVSALKDTIDSAKQEIANRNGVGEQLTKANDFHRSYMELMHDPESALTKVRDSVGTKNSTQASDEFFRNKGDEIAVGRLKSLRSVYARDANAVADLTQNLKAARNEAAASRMVKSQEIPAAPKPVSRPEAPTAESIVAEKQGKVLARGQSVGELHRATAFEVLSLPLKSLMSNVLKRPAVVEWIARPTAADLIAIDKLPDPLKAQLRGRLQQIMNEESAAGRPLTVAPAVRSFVARNAPAVGGGSVAAGVANRRDAREAMGQPTP